MGLAADDPVAQASIRALQQGLRVLGWLEGTNLAIEYRYVAGSTDPANAAAELVTLQCEVIVARGRQWSQRFSGLPAPFQSFLQPLANPLRAILSPVTSIPEVLLLVSLISSPQSPASGSSCLRRSYPASGDVPLSPLVNTNQRRINTLAIGAQLPTFYAARDYVETGGLMSYGPNYTVLWRRTADFVDKILQGTNPADIPVEQPVKFDLVVNLTTAKAPSARR
jgi:hypothetical protein